ncbi:MAG TPA: FAD-dependent oxidoreductase [bacterium]|nr:FAD-dependent oxidoreductase [Candidatus Omnitrophota bacterium]HOJ59312.1 FAD-dependent oxidoreductase [bacterium]HOL94299.1 FAD-dependent oxidoreductase [bacterium]HPO99111.1 FAD-dependent oxidoreductase [bacterium]HXK92895.1 FAD-dependent oxidoreductase [bacterium]
MNERAINLVILGAGIAGLATAWKLLREQPGRAVILIERDAQPGGLAKTIAWKGYNLDLGPHRFHTEIPEVKQFIKTFCQERMITVQRASRMFLNGRYIPYPIQVLPALRALGLTSTLSFTASALSVLFRRNQAQARSYEEYVIGYYGKPLYRRIFQPFAEKVWGIPASRINAETARVRLRGENIWHALRDSLLSSGETYVAEFLYPPNGIGEISRKFAGEIEAMGGLIHYNHEVTAVGLGNSGVEYVEAQGPEGLRHFPCEAVVSTIPLPALAELMHPAPSPEIRHAAESLRFRALVLLYLLYPEDLSIPDTWLYYPEKHVPFSRISVPGNFNPHGERDGRTCLCVEFPCALDSETWKAAPLDLARRVDEVLLASRLVATRASDALAVRIREGYPLYEIGYEQHRRDLLSFLRSLKNLLTAGRQGLFRHNNLDQSIQMGILAAEEILRARGDFYSWYDHVDRFNQYRIVD